MLVNKIKALFRFKDADRSSKAKKNIVLLLITHGFNFFSILLIVPLTLEYLGKVEYGIWLTLNSILIWIGHFDLGIGNGLRIKLSESFAQKDFERGKIYTSTAYVVFSIVMMLFFLLFLIVNQFLDWTQILNTPVGLKREIETLVLWVLALFLIQFILRLLSFIIIADQRVALNGVLTLIINIFTVIFLIILNLLEDGSLLKIAVGFSFIPVAVFAIASFILFKNLFVKISPSINKINLKHSNELFTLGGQFFVIQVAGLILFASDNMVITQILGPSDVAVYNIAFRYFYFIPMLFNIVLNPILPAFTEAYVKNDFDWIKNATNKIIRIWILLSSAVIVMIFISSFIYRIWVGNEVEIPFDLSLAMGAFVILMNWNNIFAFFLNGVGKIRLQFYSSIFAAVINIPVSIWFAKGLGFGITGVMLGTILCLLLGASWAPLQYQKIVNKKDKGIWSK